MFVGIGWNWFRQVFWVSTMCSYQDSRTSVADTCVTGFPSITSVYRASKQPLLSHDRGNIFRIPRNTTISETDTFPQR